MTVMTSRQRRQRRRYRVRAKVSGSAERPRLSVYRSNRGIFAQLIDDVEGKTLASANWTEPELKALGKMEQARKAGELIAARAKDAGIGTCVFDRSGYRYHGRVKALAEGARVGGLEF
jgi:large subunit ribosomal protein L18